MKSSGLKKEGSFAGREKHRKPWPEDIDEWIRNGGAASSSDELSQGDDRGKTRAVDKEIGKVFHTEKWLGREMENVILLFNCRSRGGLRRRRLHFRRDEVHWQLWT